MVTAPPIPPSINADVTTGTVPLVVTFTGSEPATYEVNYIEWDYGDDSTNDYATWTPIHVYNVPGVYDVNLYVENILSFASTTESAYITVTGGGPLPATDFTVNDASVYCLEQITFTDLSTNYPTTWNWNFGDTTTSTLQNPVHTYGNPGTYTVALEAANWNGSDTETKTGYITITMAPYAPVVAFSATPLTYATLPVSVVFTDESTNGPTSWQWNFGDGYVSTSQNPTHNYTVSGSYTVTLIATNTYGSSTLTKTNYITVGDYSSTLTRIKIKRAATTTWESATTPHYLDGGELGYDKTVKQLRIGNSETESVAFASCDLIAGGSSYTAGYGIDITDDEISVDTLEVATPGDIPTLVSELTNDSGYITGIDHNDTTNIQGGETGEYYHLNADTYNSVATTGDIPTYTGGTGIDVAGTVISVDPTEAAVLPDVWVQSRYLKSTAVDGTLEWATAGGGSGSEYAGGYGIDIDNVNYIITTDSTEVASLPPAWESNKFLLSTETEGTFEWATTFNPQVTKVLYVDKNRTDYYTPDGSIDKPFLTIGAATSAATDYTTIYVVASAYTDPYVENVTLGKGVNLIGVGDATVYITGSVTTYNDDYSSIQYISSTTLNLNSSCILEDTHAGDTTMVAGLAGFSKIKARDVSFSNVIVGNACSFYADMSMFTMSGGNAAISSSGTVIIDTSYIGGALASDPIVTSSGGYVEIYNSYIYNASTGPAVDVSGSTGTNVLANNQVRGNVSCGSSDTIIDGLHFISGALSGTSLIFSPASRLDNDSSVTGDTVKDALETLYTLIPASYTEGYGIDILANVISVDTNSVASHDWVTAQGYLTSVSHNDTTSIQGGAPGQYYHLDSDTFNTVATTGDIPTYTGGTGITIAEAAISVNPTEAAVLPAVWESGKYLKATVVEGTLEWATAGGTGAEYSPGYGINIADYVISSDTNEMASVDWVTAQGYLTGIEHNNTTSIQGGATGQYYHLDVDTYNNVATSGDIPTLTSELVNDSGFVTAYTEGHGIDVTGQVISIDSLVVATIGVIIPGVVVDSSDVYIQTDDPTPRRSNEDHTIRLYSDDLGNGVYLYNTSEQYTSLTNAYGFVQYDNTGPAAKGIDVYKDYIKIYDSTLYNVTTFATGIVLTDNSIGYDFYNEKNLDISEFAVLPTPWESGKYLKATAVEGTLEWATAGGTGGGITDVPDDGNLYVREYENWVQLGTLIYSTDDDDVTLPASPNVGDSFEMIGTGTAWTVHANTGQYIRLDGTESVVTGVATSASGFGCASFIYIGAVGDNNTWLIRSAAGVIGVT